MSAQGSPLLLDKDNENIMKEAHENVLFRGGCCMEVYLLLLLFLRHHYLDARTS